MSCLKKRCIIPQFPHQLLWVLCVSKSSVSVLQFTKKNLLYIYKFFFKLQHHRFDLSSNELKCYRKYFTDCILKMIYNRVSHRELSGFKFSLKKKHSHDGEMMKIKMMWMMMMLIMMLGRDYFIINKLICYLNNFFIGVERFNANIMISPIASPPPINK